MFTGSDFERDRNRMNALENDSLDEFQSEHLLFDKM